MYCHFKFIILTTAISLAINVSVFSQGITKALMIPQDYYHITVERSQAPHKSKSTVTKSKTPWRVVADRSNVTTGSGKRLVLGDYFYVVEEQSDKVHIVKDKSVKPDGTLSAPVDYGWVAKSQILLWPYAMVQDDTGIDMKALLINKENLSKSEWGNFAKIYNYPIATDAYYTQANKPLEAFYFIMKKEGECYLLAKNVEITQDDDLVGWVHSDKLQVWDTRVALEPNWEEKAFQERATNLDQKGCMVFGRVSFWTAAEIYAKGLGTNTTPLWDFDPVKIKDPKQIKGRRMWGDWIRMPVITISPNNANLYNVGVSSIIREKSLDIRAKVSEGVRVANTKTNNINVVFVIDATYSMAKFYPSIATAIGESIEKMRQNAKGSIRFGAVLYRDIKDDVSGGLGLYQVQRLIENHATVKNWISAAKCGSAAGDDYHEAMYYGIDRALNEAGFSKDATNIIVVLGDAGDFSALPTRVKANQNHKAYIDRNKLLRQLDDFDVHLMGIQCIRHNKNSPAGGAANEAFYSQIQDLMYENAKNGWSKAKKTDPELKELGIVESNGRLQLVNSVLNGRLIYPIAVPKIGNWTIIKDYDVSDELVKLLDDATIFQAKVRETVNEIINEPDAIIPDEFRAAVKSYFSGLTESDFEELAKGKYKFMLDGYTPFRISNCKYPLYKHVLLMPDYDLKFLIRILKDLRRAEQAPAGEQREELYNAWKDIMRMYVGSEIGINPDEVTMDQIDLYMQGIPLGRESILKNVKLKDINNERMISDEEINMYLEKVAQKITSLEAIHKEGSNHFYSFTKGSDLIYYWIPAEFLP